MALLQCTPAACLTAETRTTNVCTCPLLQTRLLQTDINTGRSRHYLFNEAVRNSDFLMMEKLVHCGVSVNTFDSEGETALTRGCFNGNLKMVKFLVGLGADVRLANRAGWSCLHIATFTGNLKLMTFLIRTLKEQRETYTDEADMAAADVVYNVSDDVIVEGRYGDVVTSERALTPPPES